MYKQENYKGDNILGNKYETNHIYNYPLLSASPNIRWIKLTKIKIENLKPLDLLGNRAKNNFYKDFYFERPILDDSILKSAQNYQSIILTGKALSGKSRAIYNLINKHYTEGTVIVVSPYTIPTENTNSQKIRNVYNAEQFIGAVKKIIKQHEHTRCFFIFDDLERFLEVEKIEQILSTIIESDKLSFLSTCRDIEYEKFSETIDNIKTLNNSQLITIQVPILDNPSRSSFEKQLLQSIDVNIINSEVDNTIGSYFLNLGEMRSHYQKLQTESLEKEILWGFKIIHFFKKREKRTVDYLQEYLKLRYLNYYKEQYGWKRRDIEKAINKLHKLGFLYFTVEDGSMILNIEDVYLDKIIVSDNSIRYNNSPASIMDEEELLYNKELELADDIITCYSNYVVSDNQNLEDDFDLPKLYNTLFARIKSLNLRRDIYGKMITKGIEPDEITFNIFIWKSNTIEEAELYYKKLREANVKPNSYTLNLLLHKYPSFKEAYERYQLILKDGAKPSEHTLRGFVIKTSDFTEMWEFYKEVKALMLDKVSSIFFFYSLIGKTETFPQAYLVYEEIQSLNMQPNLDFYKSLIRKEGGEFETNLKIYKKILSINKDKIKQITPTSLIRKAPDFSTAKKIFYEAKQMNIVNIGPMFYTSMVMISSTFKEAKEYFDEMVSVGVKPTREAYNTLIGKADTMDEIHILIKKMTEEDILTDSYTYCHLIKKSNDFITANHYFEEMYIEANISPTLNVINALLGKINYIKNRIDRSNKALEFYQIIEDHNLLTKENGDASKRTFNLIIRKFVDTRNMLNIIKKAHSIDIHINEKQFRFCIIFSNNYTDIEAVFETMAEIESSPSPETIVEAIDRATKHSDYQFIHITKLFEKLLEDFDVGDEIFAVFFDAFIKADRSNRTDDDIKKLYNEFWDKGKEISSEAYEGLIWKELNSQERKDIKVIVDRYDREHNKKVEIPPVYLENFLKRCQDYESSLILYNQMIKIGVTPQLHTFEVILEIILNTKKHTTRQITDTIDKAYAVDDSFPCLLFEELLNRPFPDKDKLIIFQKLKKMNLKISINIKEEIYWLKVNQQRKNKKQKKIHEHETEILINSLSSNQDIPRFLKKCIDFDDAFILLSQAVKKTKKIKEEIFEDILWLCTNATQARQVAELLKRRNVKKTGTIVSQLIRHSATFDEAQTIFLNFETEYPERFNEAHDFLSYTLLQKAESYEHAYKLNGRVLQKRGGNHILFGNTLGKKTQTESEAKQFLSHLTQLTFAPSENLVIHLLNLFSGVEAWELLNLCSKRSVIFNQMPFLKTLAKKASNSNSLNITLINKLIDQTKNYKESILCLKLSIIKEIPSNQFTFEKLIQTLDNEIELDEAIELTSKAPFFITSSIHEEWKQMFKLDNPQPSDMKSQTTPENFNKKWNEYNDLKLHTNFSSTLKNEAAAMLKDLTKLSTNFEESLKVYNEYKENNFPYIKYVFSNLIKYAASTDISIHYLNLMLSETDIDPNVALKSIMKNRQHKFDLQWKIFNTLKNRGYKINKGIPNRLIKFTGKYDAIKELVIFKIS